MEGSSHFGDKMVVSCITNQAMHLWVKCTNINKMLQCTPEISSKANDTIQKILAQDDVRHTSYWYQEILHLASKQSMSHHAHLHMIHTLHNNTVMIKKCATRNT